MLNRFQNHRRLSAFTLVELLVVIFIIALLSTLILVGVNRAQRSSRISKTKSELAAISSAIEQYHNDFRVYPGLPTPPAGSLVKYTILAQALVGPGDALDDGAEGTGFRIPDPSTGQFDPHSKKWDAYLAPEHFRVTQFARGWAFLDSFDNPIRYYPKRKTLNPKQPSTLVDATGNCIFDARDGEHPQTGVIEIPVETFQVLVGDLDNSNAIDGNESLLVEGNFVLGSAGPDGVFTLYTNGEATAARRQKMTKSDDIFNFER
jgi:prepilin-type N-terminal cleavage/methylation domain-containing protein